jgi:hypothetical protein
LGIPPEPPTKSVHEERFHKQKDLDGWISVRRESRVFPKAVDSQVQVAGLRRGCPAMGPLISRWVVPQSLFGSSVNVLLEFS